MLFKVIWSDGRGVMDWKDLRDSKLCIRVSCESIKENIYIYGTDRASARLFFQLSSLHVRIKGFVEKENGKINSFYHKPIYTINELQENSTVLTSDKDSALNNFVLCENFFEFNKHINKNHVVIYGCGECGRKLKKYLDSIDVNVECYIETNSKKIGTVLDGIPVWDKESLKDFRDDVSVISAGKYWQEMDDIVQKTNEKLDRYYIPNSNLIDLLEMTLEEGIVVDFEKKKRIRCYELFSLEEHYADKELVLYGSDIDLIKKYADIYALLDFKSITIAIDYERYDTRETEFPVINIVDILYKNNFIILVQDKDKIKKLEELGLTASKDFVMISSSAPANPYREFLLDINLGYVYSMDSPYPGIKIYGKNKKNDFKIIVLGGSTSESDRSYIKPWVELLYDSYLGEGVTLYNCAVSGYSSGQEFIKLVRDATLLGPDLIISYSGVNEVTQVKKDSVFAFSYLYNLFHTFARSSKAGLVTGVTNNMPHCNKWLSNMKCMNAIAEINGAKFYAFVQPILSNKNVFSAHEIKMMKMINTMYTDEVFEELKLFRENASQMQEDYLFVKDLTYIFDEEDVYMDLCHVYEKGNQIIADLIWNIIKNDIVRHHSADDSAIL